MSTTDWQKLYQYRTPIDPDYGGPTSTITLWLDNLGGLVLFMDERDGEKVIGIPIPATEAEDFAAALHTRSTP
jgi:hypothetical protein